MTRHTEKLKSLKYSGHHNPGPLHLAADVAVIATVAGSVGIVAVFIVLAAVIAVIVLS